MIKPIKKEVGWCYVPVRIHCECGKSITYESASDTGWHIDTEGVAFGAYLCASCSERKRKEQMIHNLKDFMEARGFGEESFKDIERNTYEYTDCGAWIQEKTEDRVDYESPHIEEFNDAPTYKHHTGLTVGSIVEGVDYDCIPFSINYPFEMDEFWKAVKAVEDQANEIWKDTHGCDKCWKEPVPNRWGDEVEFGAWPINEECKTCKGEGTII